MHFTFYILKAVILGTALLGGILVVVLGVALLILIIAAIEDKVASGAREAAPELMVQLCEAAVLKQLILAGDLSANWLDIGGCKEVLTSLLEQVIFPLKYTSCRSPEPLLRPPKGVLLHGPPGCGKTLMAKVMARELRANFLHVDASTMKNTWYGEAESTAVAVFSVAREMQPCIIFLDEVDAILGARSELVAGPGLKATFLHLWDGLTSGPGAEVVVVAATHRPAALDEALLRRLPLQFEVGLPSAEDRLAILLVHLRGVSLAEDVELREVAERTEGFSGSELQEVCRCASTRRLADYMHDTEQRGETLRDLTRADLLHALQLHPSKEKNSPNSDRLYV